MESKQKGSVFRVILFLISLVVFVFSLYQLISYWIQSSKANQYREEIIEMAVIPAKKEETVDTEEIKQTAEKENAPSIAIDFQAVKTSYPDIVGWLYSPDEEYHDPVVQATNNDYYLYRLPGGQWNNAGSLFLDYRHLSDLSGWKSIVFGHNMNNGTMFGNLLLYQTQDYYRQHPYMFYFTESKTYRLDVFSAHFTTVSSSVYKEPESDADKELFLNEWIASSLIRSSVSVTSKDHILVLSTCSTSNIRDDNRFVVLAKLVEI